MSQGETAVYVTGRYHSQAIRRNLIIAAAGAFQAQTSVQTRDSESNCYYAGANTGGTICNVGDVVRVSKSSIHLHCSSYCLSTTPSANCKRLLSGIPPPSSISPIPTYFSNADISDFSRSTSPTSAARSTPGTICTSPSTIASQTRRAGGTSAAGVIAGRWWTGSWATSKTTSAPYFLG